MKQLTFASLFTLLSLAAIAQTSPQKIVFDVTSTDAKVHKATLLMMGVMAKDYPNSTFEVIVYGEALPMLMKKVINKAPHNKCFG